VIRHLSSVKRHLAAKPTKYLSAVAFSLGTGELNGVNESPPCDNDGGMAGGAGSLHQVSVGKENFQNPVHDRLLAHTGSRVMARGAFDIE
jgi:hypothetical protein